MHSCDKVVRQSCMYDIILGTGLSIVGSCRACYGPQVIFEKNLACEVTHFYSTDYKVWGSEPDSAKELHDH